MTSLRSSWFLVPACLGLVVFAVRSVPAAEGDELDAQRQAAALAPQLTEARFRSLIYGQDLSHEMIRKRLEVQLARIVDGLAQQFSITETQRKKLHLAGIGEIERFEERVNALQELLTLPPSARLEFEELMRRTQQLRRHRHADMFGPDSLFEKATRRTLNNGQWARYEQSIRERLAATYRVRAEAVVTSWDSYVPLLAEQRRQLVALLVEDTPPLKWYGPYDSVAVMVQAHRLPAERFKSILDDDQWQAIRKFLRSAQQFEMTLLNEGVLEPVAAADPPRDPP